MMKRIYLNNQRILDIDLYLLLLYSLLPGIYKILENQMFMIFSVPITAYFLIRNYKKIRIYTVDICFIVFFSYIIILSFLYLMYPTDYVNKTGILMGLFLDIIPMTGFFISRVFNFEKFNLQLIYVIAIHAIIGIILYPAFNIVNLNNSVFAVLQEHLLHLRMESVAGSLPFANLLLMGFILAFYYNKKYCLLFAFCTIFSMQRSAWLGLILSLLLYAITILFKGDYKKIIKIFFSVIVNLILFYIFLFKISNIDLTFLFYRITRLKNASSERDVQWLNGISNFISNPIGAGAGQAGHIASRYEKTSFFAVSDGDFFRMISEYGISVLLLLFISCNICLILFFFRKLSKIEICTLTIVFCCAFQMIGSNITEFYFNNFIFWFFLGRTFFIFRNRF